MHAGSKMMAIVGVVALVVAMAPMGATHAAEGRDQTSTSAERGSFSRCCTALKGDLDRCQEDFGNDPEALGICRSAAFGKFNSCVADLFADTDTLFGNAIPSLEVCPVSLPL